MSTITGRPRPERQRAQAIPIRIAIAATTSNASEAAPTVTSWSGKAPATGSAGKIDLKLSAKGAPFFRHRFDGARARQRELGRTNRPHRQDYPGGNLLSMNVGQPSRGRNNIRRDLKKIKSGASAGRNVGKSQLHTLFTLPTINSDVTRGMQSPAAIVE